MDYKGFNEAIRVTLVSYHRSENRVHPQVTESKHHAYTTNTTLTQELQGLKYSKESHKLEEQYEQDAYLN
jgi:hypothetical protein